LLKGRGSFGGEFGASIVTNGDMLSQLCESDALFPYYFEEDLLLKISQCFLHTLGL